MPFRQLKAGLLALLPALAAWCALLCPQATVAQTAYTLTTLTSLESWANPAIWTPNTSPGGTATDLAILPLGTLTGAWSMTLDSSPTIAGLTVTSAGAFGVTLNPGTPVTSTLTLHSATPGFTNNVLSGQTLTIAAPFSLDTANTLFTNNGTGNLTLSAPTNGFFANLNPAGGLGSATTLTLNNVYTNLPPLTQLKTGAGQLTLALVGAATNTFFTNQNAGSLGGNGYLQISSVDQFSSAAGTAQMVTNNSTSSLELDLDNTSPSAFLGSSSFGGLGSVSGKTGAIHIRYIHGTNTLASGVSINTVAAGSALPLNLYGYGNASPASAVVSGGTWNVPGSLALTAGLTLNLDANMGGFINGGTLILESANGGQLYALGSVTVNWNTNSNAGMALNNISLCSQGGNGGVGIFNLNGGSLTNSGTFTLGSTSHAYDNCSSYLNITNGTLVITNSGGITMPSVTTAGAQEYSYLTISNTGVLNLPASSSFKLGSRNVASDTAATKSQATVSLGGGTLLLGTPVARQTVTATTGAGSASVQFYFNGGTLQVTTNLPQVFTGFGTVNSTADAVYVAAGGAVITNGGWNVGISNNLLAASSGSGGLTYLGTGTLTLSGANTYTGNTAVNAGRLVTTTASTGGGSYSVADGATNQVVVASSGTTLNVSSLTLGTSIGATMEFNNAGFANPSAPIVTVGNALTLNGPIVVNIYGTNFSAANSVTLMTYASETVTGPGFILGSLPLGVNATLIDTGTQLQLNISSASTSLTWNGNVGSVWDINNSGNDNWLGQPAAVAAYYAESGSAGLPVTFDDTATGATTITLGVTVHPASVNINNSAVNYSITGAGSIAGPLALTKNGTGAFTLGVANNFINPVINGGTLGLTSGNNLLPVTDTVSFAGAPGTPAVLDLGGNSQSLTNLNFVTANASATAGTVQNGKLTVTVNGFNPLSTIAATATSGTLDLSGLSSFTSSNTAQTFTVQDTAATSGTFKLNLAGAGGLNNITAGTINVGQGGGTGIPTGDLYLGQTNILNASTITLGAYRGTGNVYFESGLASSNVTFRGTSGGANRVTTLTIGSQSSGASQSFTMDLGVANVDALVGTLYMPNTAQTGIAETGTLNFGNGTFDILTLDLSYGNGNGNGGGSGTTGNFNQNGGLAKIQTLNLGVNPNTGTPYLKPSYTQNSGTLAAAAITAWGATAFNNANTVRNLNLNGGTVSNYDANTDLIISGVNANSGGVVNLVLGASTTSTLNAGTGRTIVAQTNALIKGAGNLSVTGGGTVVFDGCGNSYTGLTTVANSTLKIVAGDTALGTAPASATANQLTLNGGTLSLNQGWAGSFSGFSAGSGYTNFPAVSLNQVTNASILAQGGIAGINISTAGNKLTNVTVLIAPPDQVGGVQAAATANFTTGNGLTSFTITTAGSGYTTPPNINFTLNSGATAPVANVTNVTLVGLVNANPGYNFSGTAPTVSFSGGGGSGAAATASATATAAITLSTNRGLTLGAAGGTIETVGNHVINGIITGSGALTKTGSGTLTLTNANTYSGSTVISAGTLALTGAGSIGNSPLISVANGAAFNVSGLSSTFTLGASQTLSNSASATGTLVGSLNAGTGANSVSFTAGTPAFTVTNGTLTLPSTSTFIVNNTGSALAAGSHLLISTNTGGLVAGALTNVTVNGNGYAASSIAFLSVSNSQLYLVVQSTNTAPPVLNYTSTVVGSSLQLTFTWSGNDILESQTNSLTNGYSANGWFNYPGGSASPVTVPVDPTKGSVFFRLSQ